MGLALPGDERQQQDDRDRLPHQRSRHDRPQRQLPPGLTSSIGAGCRRSTPQSSSLVRVEDFREAVRSTAAGIILVHNHRSGNPTPGADDLHVTAGALGARRLLDDDVRYHLIVAGDGWVSLREQSVSFDRVIRSTGGAS
jgi:hypothetical protein